LYTASGAASQKREAFAHDAYLKLLLLLWEFGMPNFLLAALLVAPKKSL